MSISATYFGYDTNFTPKEFVKTFPDLNGTILMVDKFNCTYEDVRILVDNFDHTIPANTRLYDLPEYDQSFHNKLLRVAYVLDETLYERSPSVIGRTILSSFRDLTITEGIIDLCKEYECCLDIIYLANVIANGLNDYAKTRLLRYYYNKWLQERDSTPST